MAESQSTQNSIPSRTLNHIIPLLLLQFLVTFAQGQGPGNSETLRANFSIPENQPVGTYVGTIPTRQYHTYAFQETQQLFILNESSGIITTNMQIDREILARNPLNILVIGTSTSTGSQYPIETFITVLDVNDNAPTFPKPTVNISLYENVISQASLDPATDLDLAENGTVSSYTIIDRTDNQDRKFEAIYNPVLYGQFLIIRLIDKLDREDRENYQLQILVKDQGHPQLSGSLTVNIFVLDNNDNQPVFGTSQYFTNINERVPIGTSVTRVEATDRDTGPNGEIVYSIIDDTNQFQIDKRTGEISTTETPLVCHSRCDRSASDFKCDSNSCILTITAEDGGTPPNAGRTYVTVKINDENNYAPKISILYKPQTDAAFSTVDENAKNAEIVAVVTVTDEDRGIFGNISSIEIIKGNEHGHFKMMSRFNYKYNLIVVNGNNILDRERISMYNLTIKASDQGTPAKSSITHLLIYVNDVNDHHPMFPKNEYRVSISETTPVGSYVLSLTAVDLDSGKNAELTYDIISGNKLGWFQIDKLSGLLTVKSPIHFQMASQLTMNVSVHDGSLKPLYNYTQVIVTIWDENNIAPHFTKQNYNLSISENAPKGSEIVVLTALDEDSGANGSVVYGFHPDVEQLYQNMFQVDSGLGKITLQSNLDREIRSFYVLKLIARDQGQPALSSTATLFISIADINDNKPKFYPQEYYANVLINQPAGTSVITVSASDADIGSNAQVVYFWDGNVPDFAVDQSTGLVTTTKSFDSIKTSPYILRVKCTDVPVQELADTAIVYVKIISQNEVGPTFQDLPYLFSIIEDADGAPTVTGRVVGTVQATTPDLQTTITYSVIGGDVEQVFAIDQSSGEITTRRKLDREVKQHYRLLVLAKGGGKYSDIYVNISVQDLNDNSPTFPMLKAEASVVENWSVGREIFLASAVDMDDGMNADITYSLQFSSDLFDIDVNTGMIFLKRPIEKSDPRNFDLNVLAQDSGNSRLSSSMLVHITILDVNDHAPVFSHNSYEISLNESISVNTQFYILTATDADLGRNAEISYNITRGNFEGKFGIFPSGNLYVAHKLNREEKDHFHLAVMAKDNAQEPRSTVVNVTIHVLDDNDNKPMFGNISYNFYVPENEPSGHILGSVSANDKDIGRNAEVSYFLEPDMDNFTIDTQTGELSTKKSFDRELLIENTGNSFYVFDVMVTDNGFNKLQNKVKVTVHITDVNDNTPKFSQQNNIYKTVVKEDAAIYTRILKIVATDSDIGENAALSYMIIGGNEENKFDINAGNGQITLNGSLDREIQDNYILQIMVTDSGKNRQYSANCTVFISVIDVNDNQPLFAQSRFEIMVPETTSPGNEIARLTATDVDLGINSEIVYSFSNQGNFQTFNIDKNTGKLYLLQPLDYERNRIYELVVLASDKGTPQLTTEAVVIIKVTDTNDNAPYFVNTSSNVSIRENIPAFSNIVKVTAVDPDSGINGKIVYDIKNQDPVNGHFSISTTGQIYVSNAVNIDREVVSLYSLTVVATDSALPVSSRKTIEKVITISVIDENDNSPYFVSSDAIIIDYPSQQGHVATIEADDNDAGDNGLIVYTLSNGDRSLFSLDSGTGKLFLKSNIPQTPVSYRITVNARDKGTSSRSTSMDFTIVLLPKSGSLPTFVNVPYNRQIRENEKAGTSVLQVQATPVVQNSPLEYYITSVVAEISKKGRYLEINSQSGVISTMEILDRELLGSKLNVTVCVVERSSNEPRAKTEQVIITILDENDTPPKFSKGLYISNIPENGNVGATVSQVLVSDTDITGQVTLGILSGNDGTFQINQQGYITTSKSLNREEKKEYELTVGASDGINSAQTMVQILVQDQNDNPPKFSRAIYSFDLPENTVKGTTLGRVEAIDVDEGASGEVNYTLVSQWGSNVFQLDPLYGTFTLIENVDFETYPLYTLTVSAQDHGNPSLSSTAIVYMNIKDINDNTPVFDLGSYSAEVLEDVTVGTSVLTVSASDRDSGMNGQIEFKIIEGDWQHQFSIGKKNGSVFTTKPLDRETLPSYDLVVMATDLAVPSSDRKSTTTQVTVIVKDVNDEFPKFVSPSLVYVSEKLVVGELAFYIKAEDKDEGENGIVTYSLASHSSNSFRVGFSNGEVFVNTALDRESVQNYTIEVVASDKGTPSNTAFQTVNIQIKDENDNDPIFERTNYDATVAENVTIGVTLVQVKAKDADIGLNGIVRYFIVGGDENFDFSMDQSSGVLRVQKKLDYERKNLYKLLIQAEDGGLIAKSSTATVTVNILDINDYQPLFMDSPYYAHVLENMASLPVYVTQVSARDDDSAINSKVVYEFRGGIADNDNNIFQIDPSTGEITCHQKLDRESQSQYKLVVFAKDSGSPRLTGTGTIIVMVDDVNDHTPTFDHGGTYIGHILENSTPNKEILTITATDRDEGKNAHITYILEGSDRFKIDSNTGVISSKVSLDREEEDHYDLVVIAKDNGAIPKSASSLVEITVDDINDNVPKFERQSYNRTIYNQEQSGTFVIGVTALDKDIGDNGLVVYTLSGSGCSQLNIDQSTGIVTREATLVSSRYTCNIQVVDKGTPQKTSFATLTVEIATSSPGNKPVFSNIGTNINVLENEKLTHVVTRVTATASGQTVQYYIAGGNIGHAFTIDHISGDIKVNGLIDYEMTKNFHLWIEARVGSNQELSTFTKVVISVVDQNDNTPRFAQPIYKESIQEEVIGAILVQVQATDPDGGQNGNIMYRLVSGNVNNAFTINQNTGEIKTQVKLDRETLDFYDLVVEAEDQGQQPRTGTTTVRVSVLDINDNPPKFSRQFYVEISEDIDIGSFVIQVVSSDPDIGDNARVFYSLPENANGRFAIDNQTGNITVISQLDTETMVNSSSGNKYYQLVVKATDSAFSVTKKVLVFVKDVNDNSPQFFEPFIFDFPEGLSAGSFVGKVSAQDADFTNNQVYYSLKIPSTEFKLNPDNGTITSLVKLIYTHDIESLNTVNRKEIIVIATDYGTPPRSSEAVIKINILDANDHKPVFEKESYFSAVPENANLGDFILNVSAEDNLDFGINAEIEYAFSGGNGTGFFRIDRTTGEITLASSLQGRQNSNYILNVQARDKGTPPLATTVLVILTITDVNFHAPKFDSKVFYATVPEDAAIGYSVASISASDDDLSGPNGRVKYYIMDGDPNDLFQIDEERGILTVQNKLDFDTVPVHRLNITVRDQGLLYKQVSAIFTVQLTDVNDNDPVFNKSQFTAFIPENSPRGHIVTQITATDKDIGDNAVIVYSLSDSIVNSKFNIDQNTGIIRTQGDLDYEQKELYSLTVMAINRGSTRKSTTNVIVHLTGVNEYFPEFVQHQYSFVINESAANGDLVGTVMATDQDHGEDGKIYYYLIGSSNLKGFKIYPTSGQIVVAGKPDYESSPQIVLNVMAKNWGSVKGNDTDQCQVKISVQDANDAPVFSQAEYNAYVLEGTGRGISVIQVTATDNDHRPQDKQFSYSILGGDSDDMFQIDAKSGLITTTGAGILDRESTPVYNITVLAIDTGTPSETGSAVVRIHLQDINDNRPFFVPQDLIGYVKENQPIGTTVMKLSDFTFDNDLPPNQGPYTYTAMSGNHNSFFSIIGSEGIVKTQVSIDREVTPEFTVPVVITDNGNPPLSSSLSFRVVIQDINDSPPTGGPITVMTSIFSNQYFQGVIADVRPHDQDTVGNYSCSIIEGDQQKFDITTGCQLQLKQAPQDTDYVLEVSGSDGLASVKYLVNLKFRAIDNSTLKDTVIIKIKNISPSQFMESKYSDFLKEITTLFSDGQKVIIYNIQELGSDILVYTAVEQSGGGYVLYDILKREILTNKPTLQINIDIVIADVGYSVCLPSLCGQGECLNQVSVGKNFHYVDSPTLVITSPYLTLDYQCKCPPEASGKHCENIVNPCGQGYCQNGGLCVNTACKCPSGWTGQYCESDINECAQSPCQNKGSCENLQGSYTCNCKEGFTGKNCEIGSDNCAAKPCSNNGICHNEIGGFRCECDFRYWGPTCQFTSVGFNEGSYMEFSPMAEYDNVIDVTFSTIKEDALLLYNPSAIADSGEFISLEIVKGNIRFSYKLDYSQTTRLTVPKSVTSGNWFRVQVHRNRKVAVVKVMDCPGNGDACIECQTGDVSCYKEGQQESQQLNLGGHALSIGGIRNISSILTRPGQVATHDFIGCIRNFTINNKDKLRETPLNQKDVSLDQCPRKRATSECSDEICQNGGQCRDNWISVSCACADGFMGKYCEEVVKPVGFSGPNSLVTFTQRDGFLRDQLLKAASGNRKRRSTDESSLMVRFRTVAEKGILAFVSTDHTYSILWVNINNLIYTIVDSSTGRRLDSMEIHSADISNGKWHNATVRVNGNSKNVSIGINRLSDAKTISKAFEFSSVEVRKITLGGMPPSYSFQDLKGFDGCISRIELDKNNLPTDGLTDRFNITRASETESGCSQLCTVGNPCPSGSTCSINFEEVACSEVAPPEEPLGIGVIVVIVFFGVLIVVIVIVFMIFRIRGRYPCKGKTGEDESKLNGNGHINKSFCNSSGHSHQDSGFGEVREEEEDIINRHIANTLLGKSYETSNGGLVKPDIINADLQQRKFPLEIDDGTVIIDNGEIQLNTVNDDMPEHYDLENASSIAPSDIDVVTHYRGFRDGKGLSYGKANPYHVSNIDRHHKNASKHRKNSPANFVGGSGYNTGLPMQSTAIHRQSPAFALDSQHLHNSSRNSPASLGNRQSPIHQVHRQSPHIRASPLVHNGGNMRIGTPSDIQHHRTGSENSLASHRSHLSHSSSSSVPIPRTAVMPNGHVKHGRNKGTVPNGKINSSQSRSVKGLTIDEINKLNSRPQGRSPVSMLEAVSSSSEGNRRVHMPSEQLSNGVMLEPPESSSSDSANDSFTCSEFEYENDRGRNDLDPSAMIFSKLTEVENETDDSPVHRPKSADGRGSNGDSFSSNCASSEDGHHGKILNGSFNWDYLLNWGPSFEKLVGVFKDIASLPDGEESPNNNSNSRNECEEYV